MTNLQITDLLFIIMITQLFREIYMINFKQL